MSGLYEKDNYYYYLQYVAIEGPYSNIPLNPAIYKFDFSNEATETEYLVLPIVSSAECNKLLAARSINLRLILFQLQGWGMNLCVVWRSVTVLTMNSVCVLCLNADGRWHHYRSHVSR